MFTRLKVLGVYVIVAKDCKDVLITVPLVEEDVLNVI